MAKLFCILLYFIDIKEYSLRCCGFLCCRTSAVQKCGSDQVCGSRSKECSFSPTKVLQVLQIGVVGRCGSRGMREDVSDLRGEQHFCYLRELAAEKNGPFPDGNGPFKKTGFKASLWQIRLAILLFDSIGFRGVCENTLHPLSGRLQRLPGVTFLLFL